MYSDALRAYHREGRKLITEEQFDELFDSDYLTGELPGHDVRLQSPSRTSQLLSSTI